MTASTLTAALLADPAAQALLTDERWREGGYRGGGPGFLFGLLWLVLLGTLAFALLRRSGRGPLGRGPGSPAAVLGERFARGEIDAEEYRARMEVLKSSGRRRG
jgi:putative membrane protein